MTANDTTHSSVRRWWLPSVSQVLWVAVFLGLFFSQQRLDMINADGDAGWHLRSGQWMLDHRAVIRAEPFLHTRAGAAVYTHDWLSEMGMAAAFRAFGWNGVTLLAAFLIATTLWLLHRQLLAEGDGIGISTAVVLMVSVAASIHWLARPLLASHLLVVLFAWNLRAYCWGGIPSSRLFALLVPLMVLWVNLHGAFFVGIVLIGMYLVGGVIDLFRAGENERPHQLKRTRILAVLLVVCLLATLLNPNGWRLPVHILQFLGTPLLNAVTFEFSSPDFHDGRVTGFLLIWLAFLLVFAVVRPRLTATEIILLGGWTFLSFRATRNVPMFAFIVAPILAEHLNALVQQRAEVCRYMDRIRNLTATFTLQDRIAGTWLWIMLCLAGVLWALSNPNAFGGRLVPSTQLSSGKFPIKATEFLRANPGAVSGEMFNSYDWGGYLELALPDRKAFIDGRNDIYGEQLLREYLRVTNIHPKWDDVLRKYRVGWVIVPARYALASYLAVRPDWKCVFRDDVAVIYTRP